MTAGNDDLPEVDSVLNSSDYVMNSDGKPVRLTGHHEKISVVEANITPGKCPRDVTEEKLKKKSRTWLGKAENIRTAYSTCMLLQRIRALTQRTYWTRSCLRTRKSNNNRKKRISIERHKMQAVF